MRLVKNIFWDFDCISTVTDSWQNAFTGFLENHAIPYLYDFGFQMPVTSFSGRGYHVLFAIPTFEVKDCPDFSERNKRFAEDFRNKFKRELGNLETRLDHTSDNRRLIRVPGTAKPNVGVVSQFYGHVRCEDEALREYLLAMDISETAEEKHHRPRDADPSCVPSSLEELLARDRRLRDLWNGTGKPASKDCSRSGYDFSLVRRLAKKYRISDRNMLATVLETRPDGAVQASDKDAKYVRRTIENALRS